MVTYALTFLAGILTVLNPCVLPLLPVILGTALNTHKFGLIAFALGMAIAFAGAGIFLAALGMALNIAPQDMRTAGAILLILFGSIMLVPAIAGHFASLTSSCTQSLCPKGTRTTLMGQFGLGSIMGVVWAPCAGPIIGAAYAMALQGENLAQAAMLMGIFALGAILPLLLFGTILKPFLQRCGNLAAILRVLFAIALLIAGLSILMGWDKQIETLLLNLMPKWWVELSVG